MQLAKDAVQMRENPVKLTFEDIKYDLTVQK